MVNFARAKGGTTRATKPARAGAPARQAAAQGHRRAWQVGEYRGVGQGVGDLFWLHAEFAQPLRQPLGALAFLLQRRNQLLIPHKTLPVRTHHHQLRTL